MTIPQIIPAITARTAARKLTDLAQGFQSGRTRDAAFDLALSFQTWRSLTQDSRLSADAAVEFVVRTIRCTVERRN